MDDYEEIICVDPKIKTEFDLPEIVEGFEESQYLTKAPVGIEKDILSFLPKELFKNAFINDVLSKLSALVQEPSFDDVALSKLFCSEPFDDEAIVIEWNYNFFRTYFYFDLLKPSESEIGLIRQVNKDSSVERMNISQTDFLSAVNKACGFVLSNYKNNYGKVSK